ncbi:MAG: lytic transglycosylase domain-containing protein [Candidatus Kapaibacterium sp.]
MKQKKDIEYYITAAKQEPAGFTQEELRSLVLSKPTIGTATTTTSTIIKRIVTMTGIGITITGLFTAAWLWVAPQQAQTQSATQQGSTLNTTSSVVVVVPNSNAPQQSTTNKLLSVNTPSTNGTTSINTESKQQASVTGVKGLPASSSKSRSPYPKQYVPSVDNTSNTNPNFNVTEDQRNAVQLLSTYKIPAVLSFCDEQVPLEDIEVRERVDREFINNLQQSGKLLIYLKRAQRWFPVIEKILKEEKMHDDLKYLCVAESELAQVSSPLGALGFWQFMEETGNQYGLRINEYVDERMNVEKSTRAACKYFRNAKAKLNSWTLSAAGYNQGVTGTERAINFQGTDNFFDLYFNDETSRYVMRIVVIKYIMEHASQFGFTVNDDVMYQPYSTSSVAVTTAITNLNDWAKEHNTTYKYLKLLNPWLKKTELPEPPQNEPWYLLIPKQ